MELAGFISKSCVKELRNIARDYPDATFITFVDTSDPKSPRIIGGSFLFDGVLDTPNKERVLVIRGFNPDSELLNQIDCGSLFEAFADYAKTVAEARGFDAVVLPRVSFWHDTATIRADAFFHFEEYYFEETLFGPTIFKLGECSVKSFNRMVISEVVKVRDLRALS